LCGGARRCGRLRARDIITQSLDATVRSRLLPPYPPRVRPSGDRPRFGSPWSIDLQRTVAFNDRGHPFYTDPAAMARGARFIEEFKAGAASRYPRRWPLPRCFGPLGAITMDDAYHHVEAALKRVAGAVAQFRRP
jgi:hypothetical protein